jgi:hypothetical protein
MLMSSKVPVRIFQDVNIDLDDDLDLDHEHATQGV